MDSKPNAECLPPQSKKVCVLLTPTKYRCLSGMLRLGVSGMYWEGIPLTWNDETGRLESIDGTVWFTSSIN